ncbi:MAG: ABC transporter family substrate-binding protein [Pseudonocardiales bacterium]|nr:ABC transporter family substrate-binding protein [Pseudonocardiales bacterium]MBV9032690.1 ABC transporter family substrate-binding protein [Pseudonocardiales bacterium]
MRGKSRRVRLLVGFLAQLACLVLAVTGCGPAGGAGRPGGGPANTLARGDKGDGSYRAPKVPAGPAVVVAHDAPFSAYNNKTARTNNNPDNAVVLDQVLVDPFVVDGDGRFLLNSDVLVSAELTSKDPQVVTYRIKPNVRWSDGQPWGCRDFYLAWLAGSGATPYFTPATTRGLDRVTAGCRDGNTFVETYRSPYADWRRNYIDQAVLPAHILERETGIADITTLTPTSAPADLKKAGDFWNSAWTGFNAGTMPASGPYRFDSSTSSERTVLTQNKAWVGSPGGPAMIVLTSVADGAAAVLGLANRQFTVVQPPADPLLADRLRALSGRGVIFEERGGPTVEHLDLDLAGPLFRDPVVRTAFAQCVDRNKLVDDLVRGVRPDAQPLGSLAFLPGERAYVDLYSGTMVADAQKAQVTLERAGWVLGTDGVYSRAGRRLSFAISHDGSPAHSREVELIRTQCRQAGMEIADGAASGGLGDAVVRGRFDVALTTSAGTSRVWSLADRYGTNGELNHQHYSNPEVDAALGIAETEYSESTRTDALAKADRLLADDLVSLPLFQVPLMWAYTSNIDSVYRHASDGVTWNANEWTVS